MPGFVSMGVTLREWTWRPEKLGRRGDRLYVRWLCFDLEVMWPL